MTGFIVFFVLFLGLIATGHVYLYRRFVRDLTDNPRLRKWGIVLFCALAVGLVVSRMVFRKLPPDANKVLSFTLWLWLGFALYAVLALWGFDLWRWIRARVSPQKEVSPERRRFLAVAAASGASAASASLVGYGYWTAYVQAPRIVEVAVKLPRLPKTLDGLVIAQLTDIHVGSIIQRRFVDDIVARTNALKPDLVAVTGDLVDGSPEHLGHAVAGLANFRSRFGTFFVNGNHEYYSGEQRWTAALEGLGIQVLRNRFVTLGDSGGQLDLVGVDDWMGDRRDRQRYDLQAAVRGRQPERAAVLLAHQPEGFDGAIAAGMGLQLSGHTHGGQMFPMTELVRLRWPHPAGLYSRDGHHLFVSRGTGFWGPPLRIGSPPEIIRMTLLSGA